MFPEAISLILPCFVPEWSPGILGNQPSNSGNSRVSHKYSSNGTHFFKPFFPLENLSVRLSFGKKLTKGSTEEIRYHRRFLWKFELPTCSTSSAIGVEWRKHKVNKSSEFCSYITSPYFSRFFMMWNDSAVEIFRLFQWLLSPHIFFFFETHVVLSLVGYFVCRTQYRGNVLKWSVNRHIIRACWATAEDKIDALTDWLCEVPVSLFV